MKKSKKQERFYLAKNDQLKVLWKQVLLERKRRNLIKMQFNSAADIGSAFLQINTGVEDDSETLVMKLLEGSTDDYIGVISLESLV